MFKILVYAYCQDRYSSYQIETSCRRDINFMWLLAGNKAPDHFTITIARFRQKYLADCIDDLFYQLVKLLNSIGEVPLNHVFIDGTKIQVNDNNIHLYGKRLCVKMKKNA